MKTPSILQVLSAAAAALILIILTAGVTAVCVRKSINGGGAGKQNSIKQEMPPAMQNISEVGAGNAAYTGVGAVHSITLPETPEAADGIPVVVTAWFSYPKDDRAFYEELVCKSTLIKKTIAAYFAAHTKSELIESGEETVKRELQDEINALLALGKVGTFYFSEYTFLD